jgi:hypothetical protein
MIARRHILRSAPLMLLNMCTPGGLTSVPELASQS